MKNEENEHRYRISLLADCIFETIQRDTKEHLPVDKAQEKVRWRKDKKLFSLNKFKKISSNRDTRTLSTPQKKLLAKALNIKRVYRDTHYTFIHGQKLGLWVVMQFMKELAKLDNPERDLSLYHFLRHENGKEHVTVQDVLKKTDNIDDHSPYFRKHLLSADAYFYNLCANESANYYVAINGNQMEKSKGVTAENIILKKILIQYLGADDLIIRNELSTLCGEYQKLERIGNIYAICVPRKKIDTSVYCAHAGGKPCKCLDNNSHSSVLYKVQLDIPCKLNCDEIRARSNFPQYRIVTDQLNPNDNRIFLLTPVTKAIKDSYKEKICALAAIAHAQKFGKNPRGAESLDSK